MASEGFHEPYETLPAEVREAHRVLQSTIEEIEAVDWYHQRAAVSTDPESKAILEHNRDEEIEHACMGLEWIRRNNTVWDEMMRKFLFTTGSIVGAESGEATSTEAAPNASAAPETPTSPVKGDTMSIFNRHVAPLPPEIWNTIDAEFAEALNIYRIGRGVVEVEGPKGLGFAAVNTGSCRALESEGASVRTSLPVVEFKFPFTIAKTDVEELLRGAEGVGDPASLRQAALKMADAENGMIFQGVADAGITGMFSEAPSAADVDAETLPGKILTTIEALRKEDVGGPFALLVGEQTYNALYAAPGYPLPLKLSYILGENGKIILAPFMGSRCALVSLRGGDFRLSIGVEAGVGYTGETADTYELFAFQTAVFQLITPEAATLIG